MKQFIDKLISEFEKMKKMNYEQYENADCNNDRIACISASNAYGDSVKITKRIAEEYKLQNVDQDFMQDLMIVESLPSLYPMMQLFEEEALARVLERAKYNNGWIPCSERLPDIGERVLLWVYGQVHIGERMGHNLFEKYDVFDLKNGTFESTNRIEAWMTLPEPYQKEGE